MRTAGFSHARVEAGLGVLEGMTTGAGETLGGILAVYDDPGVILEPIEAVPEVVGNFDEVIEVLPASIEEQQKLHNPHEEGDQYYADFRRGWYQGYFFWFVVESERPWDEVGWAPPTEADFHESAASVDPDERADQLESAFEDPFASLDAGEIGTDLCVPREMIGPAFRNEDVELVRVRVDDERNLGRWRDRVKRYLGRGTILSIRSIPLTVRAAEDRPWPRCRDEGLRPGVRTARSTLERDHPEPASAITMIDVDYDGRTVRIGALERDLPGPIEAVRVVDELIVVRFDSDDPAYESCNVRAFESDGTLRWTIESTTGPAGDENPYVRIAERNGELWAADWKGMEYQIDLVTGTHLNRTVRK
ncbi:hypothetical protein [Halovivax limisalsi]|uniref:hypothetical protein n=1 Tax=Halovivax limisalsi TaxID=1453760 RepID=UPI001FFD5C33|nr:hypothetical protein [Halovivax limisalsi]